MLFFQIKFSLITSSFVFENEREKYEMRGALQIVAPFLSSAHETINCLSLLLPPRSSGAILCARALCAAFSHWFHPLEAKQLSMHAESTAKILFKDEID